MLMNPRSIYLLMIPLIISAFTHLWNPLGFPSFWYVEEIYLQRAMHVLHGLGNVDPLTTYGHPYDHPYFGQLLLAGLLKIINYPALLNLFVSMPSSYTLGDSSADLSYSIDLLHLIPRLLIGTLAILDTFLIYKIAEHSYNSRTVAFIASLLFAVMPITWLTRKILLENLLLPLLLSSILFAIYYRKSSTSKTHQINTRAKQSILISISGILLGLAIFTKLTAFTMTPLVGYLILSRADKNFRHVILWMIPVTMIPLVWPMDAILNGELDLWLRDITWQTQRQGASLLDSLTSFFQIDPVLVILGSTSLVYAEIKRDFLILLWAAPFMIFLFLVGFVSFFYLILLIPLFCIAGGKFIEDLVNKINNRKRRQIIIFTIILSTSIFGMLNTILLITIDVNSSYLQVYTFVTQHIIHDSNKYDSTSEQQINDQGSEKDYEYNNERITLIGNMWTRAYYWIPKYVFDKDVNIILLPTSGSSLPPTINTEKILLKLDNHIQRLLRYNSSSNNNQDGEYLNWIKTVNSSTYKIAVFTEKSSIKDYKVYPYSGSMNHNVGISATEFRANY
jgi:Dolichyl-phosphate-mannose-protein mannosyltransferase